VPLATCLVLEFAVFVTPLLEFVSPRLSNPNILHAAPDLPCLLPVEPPQGSEGGEGMWISSGRNFIYLRMFPI
jgi:hypothetical protein